MSTETNWNGIYKIGAAAALGAVLVGITEILITFLPGGNTTQETVKDWFVLFQQNWFLGLRNLGLLNIILNTLGIFTFFALYGAHRKTSGKPYATLAMIIAFIGIAVFYATNRAFAMLSLSSQYANTISDSQRAIFESAGASMLAVGESHTPGTFLGFILIEIAAILMSIVMLRENIFSKYTAWSGILGFIILLIIEVSSSFISGLTDQLMILAILGGILSMLWYVLIARRLFQLAKE
jgi:hypothetical protein